jgi:methyl-accepting chemotaxis protein
MINPKVKPTRSILRRLKWSMLGFGVLMGLVFPVYADFFVIWKPGMFVFFSLGCIAAGTMIGVANQWLMNIMLVKPLGAISEVALSLREGNLRTSTGLQSNDRIGQIATDLDSSIGALSVNIVQLDQSAHVLESVAGCVISASAEVDTVLCRISDLAGGLARESGAELELIETSSAMMNDLSGSIQTLAADLDGASAEMSALAGRSRAQSADMTSNVERIRALTQRMDSFEASIGIIEESIGLVAKIVKQTEVLSLNASIEASRAGEYGKGFGVVALEIRTLAHDSASTGTRIGEVTEQIRSRLAETRADLDDLASALLASESLAAEVAGSAAKQESGLAVWSRESRNNGVSAVRSMESIVRASDSIRRVVTGLRQMEEDSTSSKRNLDSLNFQVRNLSGQVLELEGMVARFRT